MTPHVHADLIKAWADGSKQYDGDNPASPRTPAPRVQTDEIACGAQALRMRDHTARASVPIPKTPPLRSAAYRRFVASLDCIHCGRAGPSQAAHSDEGKGMKIKVSDSLIFPLCADSPGRQGCHAYVGSTGKIGKEIRQRLERQNVLFTQLRAKAAGKWPKGWPT